MRSDNPGQAGRQHDGLEADPTLPPVTAEHGWLCPRCHRAFLGKDPGVGTAWPRCPEHGLAYVEAKDLREAGGDPLLGKTVVGRFTIVARLGSGSMGAVYRARQEAFGRDVALKIVRRDRAYDPETKARFEREARATSSLVSPHTVTVFDFGEAEDGSWFLAMEMLAGETLGQRLRRVGSIPWPEAIRIAREALKSLAEAHAKGIVHRDLKPDNLFLMEPSVDAHGGQSVICKVLDFGIAKWVREDVPLDQLETQAGTVFGTPRYMSPEQAQGRELDERSDLYSLGVILYQMLTGRAPFVDDDAVVVMARHIKDPPPNFSTAAPEANVPPEIEQVALRALTKDPAERPQRADEFIAELDRASDGAGVPQSSVTAALAPVAATLSRQGSVERPRRWLLWAAIVVLLCVGVGAVVLRGHEDRRAPQAGREPEDIGRKISAAPLGSAGGTEAFMLMPAPVTRAMGHDAGTDAASPRATSTPVGSASTRAPQRAAPTPARRAADSNSETVEKRPDERYGRFR